LSIRIRRSLRRKTKTQIEALRTRSNSPHYSTRQKRTSFIRSKPQNQTHENHKQNKQKTDTANAQVQYSSAPPSARVSPHNNNSANQFNFILQN
jgi:hypothetical protein